MPNKPLLNNSRSYHPAFTVPVNTFGFLVLGAFLMFLSATASAEWTEWITNANIKFENHDNLNRSAFSNDEESESITSISGSFGRSYQISSLSRVSLTANVILENYNKFDELNGGAWGAEARVHKKFGVGPDKPWMSIYARYQDWNRDYDFWATENIFIGLQLGKSFTPRWSAWVGVEQQDRSGSNGPAAGPLSSDVFSEEITQWSAETSFSLTESLLLSLRLDIWSGEFHSACTVANVMTALDMEGENVRAIALDSKVFGGCVYSIDDGDGESARLSLSYSVNRHSSLDLSYQRDEAEGDELDYKSSFFSASYSYRF